MDNSDEMINEVIEKSRETIKMKEDRERWRRHFLEDKFKNTATPNEAFAAGWKAAYMHRMQDVMEAQSGFTCPNCLHNFVVTIPVIVPEKEHEE